MVDWTCNFDVDVRHCKPKYNFHGLYGNPDEKDKARASVGYNFRCVNVTGVILQKYSFIFFVVRCFKSVLEAPYLSRYSGDISSRAEG